MSHHPPESARQAFDLEAYRARVGYAGTARPTLSTLEALHAAHMASIPFENLDVRLGRPIRLDLEGLQDKLVGRRRGGYCFEQNTLFAAALRAAGFSVETLEARVRPPRATATLPRTHMLLRVEIGGRSWLADVGYGGEGPVAPVPMDGGVSEQPDAVYRVAPEGALRVLRRRVGGIWSDLYAFGPTPALPVDFEVASHFTSTHPSSVFLRTLTVQRSTAGVRHILRGRSYTERRPEGERVQEMSPEAIPDLLATAFGLTVPREDVLRALG